MQQRLNGMRQQRGFSVMEVMVAGVLMFVLAAVGIPAYQNYLKTARQEAIVAKVNAFKVFMDNYGVDNSTYHTGTYSSTGANDFTDTGYRMSGDNADGISFTVEAGSCGDIAKCYRVVAQNKQGEVGTFEASTGKWSW